MSADPGDLRAELLALSESISAYTSGRGDETVARHLARSAGRVAQLLSLVLPGEELLSGSSSDDDAPRIGLLHRDLLTGLVNRKAAIATLEEWARDEEGTTVVFVDLDRFKSINDAYGHSTGDEILRQVAARLIAVTRAEDVVARVAGDEFLVLARSTEADAVVDVAARIADAVSFVAELDQLRVPISASAGCAVQYPGETADDVIANADVAMHLAKERGGSQLVRFDGDMRNQLLAKLSLEREIRYGLEHDEFVAFYQPVIDLASGSLIGAEALVRWNHPHRGRLEPAAFIDAAEAAGLVGWIDQAVLRLAAQQIGAWQSAGLIDGEFRVGVNVSGDQFGNQQLVDTVSAELAGAGIQASRLVLEITETAMMRDVDVAMATMGALTRVGLRLSVDDFGTGWSSLAYLKQFPVESLKIDQSFVAGLSDNPDDEAIVLATIQLADALGLRTVAEGVERLDQADALRDLGCGSVQGFLYSRPLDAATFERDWLGGSPAGQ